MSIIAIRKYLSAGLAVCAAIFAGYAYITHLHHEALIAKYDTLQVQNDQLMTVNQQKTDAIARLVSQNKIDQNVLGLLRELDKTVQDNSNLLAKNIEELRNEDEEVRIYLDTPVPPALGRLLEESGYSGTFDPDNPTRTTPGPVPDTDE